MTIVNETSKDRLRDQEARNWKAAKKTHARRLALIAKLPDDIEGIHFLGEDDTIFMQGVDTLEELLIQVDQWWRFKPEIDHYTLFYDGTIVCKFITSLGWSINTYCGEVVATLEHFSNGDCIVETVTKESKSLKCLRDKS